VDSELHTADRLAQFVEHRAAVQEVVGSNLGRTNTQGLYITEEKMLPLLHFSLTSQIRTINRRPRLTVLVWDCSEGVGFEKLKSICSLEHTN